VATERARIEEGKGGENVDSLSRTNAEEQARMRMVDREKKNRVKARRQGRVDGVYWGGYQIEQNGSRNGRDRTMFKKRTVVEKKGFQRKGFPLHLNKAYYK